MKQRTLDQLETALSAVGQDLEGRVELLAEKSSAGSLTADEHAEYGRIVRLNDLLSAIRLQVEDIWAHRAAS